MAIVRPSLGMALFLSVALLLARAGGAHLHLCFDGQQAPSQLHLGGPAHEIEHHLPGDVAEAHAQAHDPTHAHAHAHEHGDHTDRDLPLFEHLLSKTGKSSLDLPVLLFALLLLGLIARSAAPKLRGARQLLHDPPALHLRPPLRGPPLPAS